MASNKKAKKIAVGVIATLLISLGIGIDELIHKSDNAEHTARSAPKTGIMEKLNDFSRGGTRIGETKEKHNDLRAYKINKDITGGIVDMKNYVDYMIVDGAECIEVISKNNTVDFYNVNTVLDNNTTLIPPNLIEGNSEGKEAVGSGYLNVIKDLGLKSPYISQIDLVSGEIAEDFTYYFTTSEQTPSAVALGVLVDTDTSIKHAGGFIIQIMPGCEESTISQLEQNLAKITSITQLFEDEKTPEDILSILFNGLPYDILETRGTEFKCHCSKELVEDALITIGPKDIEEILATDKQAELNCHFCGKRYMFSESDLKDIMEKM